MGLNDRNYMQAGSAMRGRGGDVPTRWQRLRFLVWRLLRGGRAKGGGAGRVMMLALVGSIWLVPTAQGVGNPVDLASLLELGQAMAESVDPDQVLRAVEQALHSENLADLAAIDETAIQALSFMDEHPQLAPTADWLRQRLDFLDAAAMLAPPPAKPPSGTPARRAVPAPAREVKFWKQRLAQRSAPAGRTAVIPRLKAIFREEGVPDDLVWMAETESTLNPLARSPAGAVGLFQFMPQTAGRFGLKLAPRDERLEPEKSARAAAQYLHYLNRHFKDWPLAIAAYNAGEGRVGKALRRANVQSFDGAAPHLPPETQMYVPKVLATIALREGRAFTGKRPSI